MSMFICLVRPDGAPVDEELRSRFANRPAAKTYLPSRWYARGEFAAFVASDVPGLHPEIAHSGTWVGVGLVRLDHPHEVRRLTAMPDVGAVSDLKLVLAAVQAHGSDVVARLLGDFSFVAWNRATRELVAACDTFGVQRLFMVQRPGLLTFSTRASLLASGDDYDSGYIARYLALGAAAEGTPFSAVDSMDAAEVITYRNGMMRRSTYWPSPEILETLPSTAGDVVERFRELLFDAVRTRLTGHADVWSQLSGGMDSSSIVGVAQTLLASGRVPAGVQGALTLVSTPPTGADAEHAALVAGHYGLRLERLGGSWLWQDDSLGPPLLDMPMAAQSNYVLERRMAALVHGAGGRVMFAGTGADLYLQPDLMLGAQLLRAGHLRAAARETLRLAASARVSFWEFGRRYTLGPLLPPRWRGGRDPADRIPRWVSPTFARRYGMRELVGISRLRIAGTLARESSVTALLSQAGTHARERIGEPNLEWRYPFLYRPLVEYGLRLPPEWLWMPRAAKRVLREAMRGILPEQVRTRQGKGGLAPHYPRAVVRERGRLLRLVNEARLAELGCIDRKKLAALLTSDEREINEQMGTVINVLSLELWMQRREGAEVPTSPAAADSAHRIPHPPLEEEVPDVRLHVAP